MKIIATLCLLSLAFCGYSQANTEEIALMQQLYGMEKREIIRNGSYVFPHLVHFQQHRKKCVTVDTLY